MYTAQYISESVIGLYGLARQGFIYGFQQLLLFRALTLFWADILATAAAVVGIDISKV